MTEIFGEQEDSVGLIITPTDRTKFVTLISSENFLLVHILSLLCPTNIYLLEKTSKTLQLILNDVWPIMYDVFYKRTYLSYDDGPAKPNRPIKEASIGTQKSYLICA